MTTTIVGSGVVGVAQALFAAGRQHSVHLLDALPSVGRAASLANSGYLCPSLAAAPPCLPAVLRYHARHGVRIQRPPPPGAGRWAAQMAWSATLGSVGWPDPQLAEWTARSADEWERLQGPPRGAVQLRRTGAHDGDSRRRRALSRLLPELSPDGVRGHVWCPGDSWVDPEQAVRTLAAQWPEEKVDYRPRTEVAGFRTRGRQVTHLRTKVLPSRVEDDVPVDRVVLAAGAGTPALLALLAAQLPRPPPCRWPRLLPLCGYSLDAQRTDGGPSPARFAISDLDQAVTVAPLPPSGVRIAGYLDVAATTPPWTAERHDQLEDTLHTLFPDVPLRVVRRWHGFRLATATGSPWVGRVEPWDNVFINAGHGRVGMTLSLGTARWLSEQL